MKVTIQKLGITIEDHELPSPEKRPFGCGEIRPEAAAERIFAPNCPHGFSYYAYNGTQKIHRVYGATCSFPTSGPPGTAPASVEISTELHNHLSAARTIINPHGAIHIALCCPPPAKIEKSNIVREGRQDTNG